MAKNIDDVQKLGQMGMDNMMKVWGDWSKNWQAIAAEMGDYSKRSFEDGTQTLGKLMAARSLEQALEIQSSYAKRASEEYMRQVQRVSTMYVDLAKEATKPLMQVAR